NYVFDNTTNSGWGFTKGSCAAPVGDRLTAIDPNAATYHLDTAIGPSTGTPLTVGTFDTSGGTLSLSSMTFTFQPGARAPAPPPPPPPVITGVPVPALGASGMAMLMLSIGAVALAMRRATRH